MCNNAKGCAQTSSDVGDDCANGKLILGTFSGKRESNIKETSQASEAGITGPPQNSQLLFPAPVNT